MHEEAEGQSALQALSVAVVGVRYCKEDGSWTIASVKFDEPPNGADCPIRNGETFTIVGPLGRLSAGDVLRVIGRWDRHDRWGLQYKATAGVPIVGRSDRAVEAFLTRMPNVGRARAREALRKLGGATGVLHVLRRDPAQLVCVSGITPERADEIAESFLQHEGAADAFLWLTNLDIPQVIVARALERWGAEVRTVLSADPYALVELPQIGFKQADTLAREKFDVSEDDPRRCRAAARIALDLAENEGHCWSTRAQLTCDTPKVGRRDPLPPRIRREVGLAPEQLDAGIEALRSVNDPRYGIVIEEHGGASESADDAIMSARIDQAERTITRVLARIAVASPREMVGVDQVTLWGDKQPAPEQRAAIDALVDSDLLVITGGPGVGKTLSVNAVLRALEANRYRVGLCAPTGKAAKRMAEQTGREATTIHRMLRALPDGTFRHDDNDPELTDSGEWLRGGPIDYTAVIADEMSMVDVSLMEALVRAIPVGAKLVIVGDVDQLPSVGPGAVLHDIIESGIAPVIRLTKIFRQATESRIPYFAREVNTGEVGVLPASGGDVRFIECDDAHELADLIVEAVDEILPHPRDDRPSFPHEMTQLICAQKKGVFGVEAMNRALQARLNPGDSGVYIAGQNLARDGDRVIHVKNNYQLLAFNGDMGTVVAADFGGLTQTDLAPFDLEEDLASDTPPVLVVDYGDRYVAYKKQDCFELQLAYAITIHKSQGSQFPCTIIPVHAEHGFMLTRSLLYTGATRAEKLLVLIGQEDAVRRAATNTRGAHRRTKLQERLRTEHEAALDAAFMDVSTPLLTPYRADDSISTDGPPTPREHSTGTSQASPGRTWLSRL